MKDVFIVHTLNEDLTENELKVFFEKSVARIYSWNYYMINHFDSKSVQNDWISLLCDNEIYCNINDMNIKTIWITYHKVSEDMEPRITFSIDLDK